MKLALAVIGTFALSWQIVTFAFEHYHLIPPEQINATKELT